MLLMRNALILTALLVPPGLVGAIPLPDIPLPNILGGEGGKSEGNKCVEDTDLMRKNHMDLLKHQRIDTTHRGIRSKKHSLKECINCHTVMGAGNLPVSAKDPKHFCNSCHGYAAITIDCFQCHASQPRPAGHGDMPAEVSLSAAESGLPSEDGLDAEGNLPTATVDNLVTGDSLSTVDSLAIEVSAAAAEDTAGEDTSVDNQQ